jgi:tight adherence protein C
MFDLVLENALLRWLLLALVFALVAVAGYFIAQTVGARQMSRQRLLDTAGSTTAAPTLGSLRAERIESAWLKLVNSVERQGLSLVDTKDLALRQQLIAAGYPAPHAPRVYTLVRLVLVIGLPILVLTFFWMTGASPSMMKLYFSLVIAAALGLYLPNIFIRAKADRRQRELVNAFPDALDLMLVCVEAGLGLEAAFARIGM